MAKKKNTGTPKPAHFEPQPEWIVVDRRQMYALTQRIRDHIERTLLGYAAIRSGQPTTLVPSVPDSLSDILMDTEFVRHAISLGEEVSR